MANLKTSEKKSKAQSMGMHTEVLTGRTQQKFFNPDEAENFYYFGTYDVDFNKRTDLDVKEMSAPEANKEIDNLMSQGYGTIVIKNPQGKHSLGVGILNKLNLIFEGDAPQRCRRATRVTRTAACTPVRPRAPEPGPTRGAASTGVVCQPK